MNKEEEKFKFDWELKRKPVTSILWTNILNSSPIEDMREWQKDLANICGIYGNVIEFNKITLKYVYESYEPKKWEIIINKLSDISSLLWSGNTKIIINEDLRDGIVIVKSIGEYLPDYYKDIEATVF